MRVISKLGFYVFSLLLALSTRTAFGGEAKVLQDDVVENSVTKRSVEESAGGTLVVKLETKANGYLWKLSNVDSKSLELVGEPEVEHTANKPGASEFKVYRFKVNAPGDVSFSFGRPSGSDRYVLDLKVTVKR